MKKTSFHKLECRDRDCDECMTEPTTWKIISKRDHESVAMGRVRQYIQGWGLTWDRIGIAAQPPTQEEPQDAS